MPSAAGSWKRQWVSEAYRHPLMVTATAATQVPKRSKPDKADAPLVATSIRLRHHNLSSARRPYDLNELARSFSNKISTSFAERLRVHKVCAHAQRARASAYKVRSSFQ